MYAAVGVWKGLHVPYGCPEDHAWWITSAEFMEILGFRTSLWSSSAGWGGWTDMAEAPERYCGNCGQQLQPEEQVCPNCGRLGHETAHVPTPEADVPLPPPPQAETEETASPPPQERVEAPPPQEQAGVPPQGSSREVRLLVGGIGALLLVLLLLRRRPVGIRGRRRRGRA